VDTLMVALALDGGPAGEAHPATVSSFRLDKYDVTVGRFRQFVNVWNGGAGYLPPPGSGKHAHLNGGLGLANGEAPGAYEPGWIASYDSQIAPTDDNLTNFPYHDPYAPATWTASPESNENLPMTYANWFEAYAFCIWDGGFLPSEAEWEYAAAGGSDQREYPWGSADPGGSTNLYVQTIGYDSDSGTEYYPPVGMVTMGAGRWGQLDLEGEVTQWVFDWPDTFATPCVDCASWGTGSGTGTRWEMGCGSFFDPESFVPSRITSFDAPTTRSAGAGFRCARMP
jgi:formylglycine-generating enzyme required for sulfatase activity